VADAAAVPPPIDAFVVSSFVGGVPLRHQYGSHSRAIRRGEPRPAGAIQSGGDRRVRLTRRGRSAAMAPHAIGAQVGVIINSIPSGQANDRIKWRWRAEPHVRPRPVTACLASFAGVEAGRGDQLPEHDPPGSGGQVVEQVIADHKESNRPAPRCGPSRAPSADPPDVPPRAAAGRSGTGEACPHPHPRDSPIRWRCR